MNEQIIKRLMLSLIGAGVALILLGVGLVIFTDLATDQGVRGVWIIAGLIAGGLFLSLPAKLYLTLKLMQHNDAQRRAQYAREQQDKNL